MPTSLQLTPTQIIQLISLRVQPNSTATAAWAPFYKYLAQTIRNTVLQGGTEEVKESLNNSPPTAVAGP